MRKKIEIFSKDENLMVIVDQDYSIHEVLAYIPALDCWRALDSKRLYEQAEKLVQEYIEENNIKIDDSVDDFGSSSYINFVSNF